MNEAYFDILKDTLYVHSKDAWIRRSAQTALHEIYGTLVKLLAPVLVFTADEAWRVYPVDDCASVHESAWPSAASSQIETGADWDWVRELRDAITPFLETKREAKVISANLEAQVRLYSSDKDVQALLKKYAKELPRIFVVSRVDVVSGAWDQAESAKVSWKALGRETDLFVAVDHAGGKKCVRCWTYHEELGKNEEHPEICGRCTAALAGLDHQMSADESR